MSDITDADRQHLARILGMLGSEHQGERDNAARQAEAFRRKHGLTWEELIQGKVVYLGGAPPWARPQPEPAPPEPAPTQSEPEPPEPPMPPRYSPQRATDRAALNVFTVGFALAVVIVGYILGNL